MCQSTAFRSMRATNPPHAGVLRHPAQVMRLDRLGAIQPCRLSFTRQLLRRIDAGGWRAERRTWAIGPDGEGHAVYVVDTGARHYTLVADCSANGFGLVLYDGLPGRADLDRLLAALAERGPVRMTERDLCFARGWRDPDLWPHVLARLAAGQQPDPALVAARGGLMHCAAPLASGMAGTTDRDLIADRAEMHAPYQAELLMLWLARGMVRDLIEQAARTQGGKSAVPLAPAISELIGLVVVVGLGLAAFPVKHPCLFNTWIMAREQAVARVTAVERVDARDWSRVIDRLDAMDHWVTAPLRAHMASGPGEGQAWARLTDWAAERLPTAAQEALASAMLEPYAALVDGLGHCMSDTLDRDYRIDGAMPVGRVRALIEGVHGWALERDWSEVSMTALAWSWTADEADPRLQPRGADTTGPFELPLAVVHDAVRAWHVLGGYVDELPVAQVLLEHPEHRSAIRRAQIAGFAPYAEIRDNLVDADMRPELLIRAMLAFMGAEGVALPCDRQMGARFFSGTPCPLPALTAP